MERERSVNNGLVTMIVDLIHICSNEFESTFSKNNLNSNRFSETKGARTKKTKNEFHTHFLQIECLIYIINKLKIPKSISNKTSNYWF